ncbi:putative RNA-binding protein [Symbiodinium microadriaticum]|uniref:Putative RNA-binding protein n=1 Tax=Symbiodinium microadriaticum TaxID=2951 RepID=A0A1Q9CEL3_SYMMI|nr:putative RNA-binding protein [Symbiodinium microadriaticum]CAE7759604.1 unnamed protein product [Symbiodinium microadriaticum]CAE7944635.1 unnamed protein product [Symbiodinium sp. KB8]
MFTPPETGNIRTLLQRWANDRPKAIHWCQSACRLTAKVPFFALCFEGKRRAGYGETSVLLRSSLTMNPEVASGPGWASRALAQGRARARPPAPLPSSSITVNLIVLHLGCMAWKPSGMKLDMTLDELAEKPGRRGQRGEECSGNSVFVGNLPYSCTWQELKDHMRQAGDVLHCDILAEPGTALGSKGCGLVEFANAAAATRAVNQLTDTEIKGRKIFVREDREPRRPAQGRKVFVGNLPYSVTWQALKDHMRQCGEVLRCDILAEPGTAMGSKGCGIVEYASAASAQRAIRDLSDSELKGRLIFVREDREDDAPYRGRRLQDRAPAMRARSRSYDDRKWRPVRGGYPAEGGGGSGCRVFVGNLAYSVTWQELKDHMRDAGQVMFCQILKEPGTALGSKGCALVEYSTPREARKAINMMTDSELRGRKIWVREDREE